MNFMNTPEFKVGLLVVVVSVLVGVMSMKVSEDPSFMGTSKQLYFLIDDASGLIKKGPVRVAGIRVGVIADIRLQKGQARVEMLVRSDVRLSTSSKIEIRANGILGDKNVEIIPGSLNDPDLSDGGQIMVVEDNASMDRLMSEVSKITTALGDVADNIRDATEGDDSKPIGKIVKNLENLTGDLAQLVGTKKEEVGQLITRLNNIAGTLDELINDETDEGFKQTWKRSMVRIDSTLTNIDEISQKVNKGEGTIGRLLNDEETVEELNTAISGINNFIDAGTKMSTSFDYYTHYISEIDDTRSYIGIKIQPGLDRFYEIAVSQTPEGVVQRMQRETVVNGGAPQNLEEETRQLNNVSLTALFGKRFYNFAIKGGVIENWGGLGMEYYMFKDSLKFQVDAFNMQEPQVRGYVRYNFFKGLYVTGGQQFIFDENGNDNASTFFGAGLFLTNDDIKVFLQNVRF